MLLRYKLKPFLFYRGKYLFWEYDLENLHRGWENPHGVTFSRFGEKDYPPLENALRRIEPRELFFNLQDVRERLRAGHVLYLAKKNDDIIGFFWSARNFIDVPFFHGTFYLNEKECLSLNAVVVKEWRGKGIFNRLKAYAYHDSKNQGYRRVIGFCWHRNQAAIRMNQRFGNQLFGAVHTRNFLSLYFRRQTFSTNRIVFHGGPLLYWKLLFRKIKRQILPAASSF
jgi:GNAT superfamily N-acetyltransferase